MNRSLIMVVDDESKIRRLIATNLELEGFDVMTAADGAQALEVYERSREKPDLILLDLMMPELDGMSFLKRIRKYSNVPIIILSAKDERPTVLEGFREGADDFVSKPFYIQELLERVRAVLRRTKFATGTASFTPSSNELVSGQIKLIPNQRLCLVKNNPVKLTDTEFRLMQELVKHSGEVLTHEQLLRSVWGEQYIGELQYLRVTLTRIRRKLEQAGLNKDAIVAYSSVGYMLEEE